jgi:hypothetical protein
MGRLLAGLLDVAVGVQVEARRRRARDAVDRVEVVHEPDLVEAVAGGVGAQLRQGTGVESMHDYH